MEKDKIVLTFGLLLSILLLLFSLIAIFNPKKIKERHEKSLKNNNNFLTRYALKQSMNNTNNISLIFTGFVGLIMSIIMIYVIVNNLFFK